MGCAVVQFWMERSHLGRLFGEWCGRWHVPHRSHCVQLGREMRSQETERQRDADHEAGRRRRPDALADGRAWSSSLIWRREFRSKLFNKSPLWFSCGFYYLSMNAVAARNRSRRHMPSTLALWPVSQFFAFRRPRHWICSRSDFPWCTAASFRHLASDFWNDIKQDFISGEYMDVDKIERSTCVYSPDNIIQKHFQNRFTIFTQNARIRWPRAPFVGSTRVPVHDTAVTCWWAAQRCTQFRPSAARPSIRPTTRCSCAI